MTSAKKSPAKKAPASRTSAGKKKAVKKAPPAKAKSPAKKAAGKAKPASKAPAKKAAPKKTAVKKTAVKKAAVKKSAVKKTAVKKAAVKKPIKAKAKKGAEKAKEAPKVAAKKSPVRGKPESSKPEVAASPEAEVPEEAKKIVLGARKRHATPSVFKARKSRNTPIVFTMEDVAEILDKKGSGSDATEAPAVTSKGPGKKNEAKANDKKAVTEAIGETVERKNHGAVSVADILGFNPAESAGGGRPEKAVPRKWSKFHKALLELRDHVSTGLALHSADTLKRSNKEDSGDLSGYGQHSADAGTDTFDRDLALSLVSNEQELLYEIEEAIQRIHKNTYGICEITGSQIDKERLMAVPFTRCSLEGQRELERTRKNKSNRGALFSADSDETFSLGEEDADN